MSRKSVNSTIRANAVYPKHGSPKSADAEFVNVVLTDDEALNLAQYLIQASRESLEVNIRFARKAAKKTGLHGISITYDDKKAKAESVEYSLVH